MMANVDAEEKLLFEWFIHRTYKKMPGTFASPLWLSLIPQASSQQPAVLHSILALASAHKVNDLETSGPVTTAGNIAKQHESTLRQYNKAIRHVLGSLSQSSRNSQRLILVTNVVFTCIEYMRRQYKTGFLHLQNGTKLLKDFHAHNPQGSTGNVPTSPSLNLVDAWLIETFGQLNLQIQLLGSVAPSLQFPLNEFVNKGMPKTFTSEQEARGFLDALFSDTYKFYANLPQDKLSLHHPAVLNAAERRDILLTRSTNWFHAYVNSQLDSHNPVFDKKLAFGILRVYYMMVNIMLRSYTYPRSEMIFDSFTDDFLSILKGLKDLLRLGRHVLKPNLGVDNSCRSFTFILDLGLLQPLYYILVKCRSSAARTEALRMLPGKSHREGIFDGQWIAIIAKKIIQMEEPSFFESTDHASDATKPLLDVEKSNFAASSIPESSRLRNVRVEPPDMPLGRLVMTYEKISPEGNFEVLTKEYDCCAGAWVEGGEAVHTN
ncbi:hypothetical protein HJFPF1_10946 [Paramyrothecium foliicola]|nr:hypothetical protein HJFPF1_10946 [Paramyrothecium foliicola]